MLINAKAHRKLSSLDQDTVTALEETVVRVHSAPLVKGNQLTVFDALGEARRLLHAAGIGERSVEPYLREVLNIADARISAYAYLSRLAPSARGLFIYTKRFPDEPGHPVGTKNAGGTGDIPVLITQCDHCGCGTTPKTARKVPAGERPTSEHISFTTAHRPDGTSFALCHFCQYKNIT